MWAVTILASDAIGGQRIWAHEAKLRSAMYHSTLWPSCVRCVEPQYTCHVCVCDHDGSTAKQVCFNKLGCPPVILKCRPTGARELIHQSMTKHCYLLCPLLCCCHSTQGITSLVCLGGFENQRRVYAWQQETIELDETKFEWGTLYEIECETVSHTVEMSKENFLPWSDVAVSWCPDSLLQVGRILLQGNLVVHPS